MDDPNSEPIPEVAKPSPQNPLDVLEAQHVFLLMKQDHRISRNVRAQWLLSNINNVIEINPKILQDTEEELGVISVIPKHPHIEWTPENSTCFKYKILSSTSITILSRRYRMVFCLDFSSSVMVVNAGVGEVMLDRAIISLRKCIEGLTTPFRIPGNNNLFKPQIYITVIAHTSSSLLPSQQVLVQGCLLTAENVNDFLEAVQTELNVLENYLAQTFQRSMNDIILNRYANISRQVSEYSLNLSNDVELISNHNGFGNTVTPDTSFVNLVRYGILALQLLPDNTSAGIVIITDGIVNLSDIQIFNSLLSQLRNNTIACSFLHITNGQQPNCCWGYPTYTELMKFIAVATYGAYIPIIPDEPCESLSFGSFEKENINEMNIYHSAFLTWSFQWSSYVLKDNFENCCNYLEWDRCLNFTPNFNSKLEQKQHIEKSLSISFETLLSCRLREGYGIYSISISNGNIYVQLILPWKPDVNIIYHISSQWPATNSLSCNSKIVFEGTYEFLHDLSCPTKKPIKSVFREIVVKKFVETIQNLLQSDSVLMHLHSLYTNPLSCIIPESIRNGVPLFCSSTNASTPVLFSSDFHNHKFTDLWEPVCKLDINIWQKWMHTHRIGVLLVHDLPLPKYLHLPNINDRYHTIQCRHAFAALTSLLANYCCFVLVENHTYINFIYGDDPDKPPVSFYIIRITSKAPCIVLRLAFLGGTPSVERNKIVSILKEKILNLSFRPRLLTKDVSTKKYDQSVNTTASQAENHLGTRCCMLLLKPVEKILIKYDRIPKDLTSPTERSSNNAVRLSLNVAQMKSSSMFGILCPYLYHWRFIWSACGDPNVSLPLPALGRILSTLVKIRLNNGFHFCYSSSGIVNMVCEVKMKVREPSFEDKTPNDFEEEYPCVIQYILFPPHFKYLPKDSFSEDDVEVEEDAEADVGSVPDRINDLQMVTECWVEPQHGHVTDENIFLGLDHKQIPKLLWKLDLECIATLLTFEQLCLMCQNFNVTLPEQRFVNFSNFEQDEKEPNIKHIPFLFIIHVLLSSCPLAQLKFSTLTVEENWDSFDEENCNNILLQLFHQGLASANTREVELSDADHEAISSNFWQRTPGYTPQVDCFPEFPRWKCYVKGLSSTHVLLTLAPDSYKDVVLLQKGSKHQSKGVNKYLLPVFIYDCSLAGLIDQLVSGVENDAQITRDYQSYAKEDDNGVDQSSATKESETSNSTNRIGKGSRLFWKQHQNNVAVIFSNCYVSSVFLSLQRGLSISFDDVKYAMEEICMESYLEVDITDFLHTICYHSKHWPPTEEDVKEVKESGNSKTLFPKTFWSSFSCPTIESVHNLIRANFTSIVNRLFKSIKSSPHYFYFDPQQSNKDKNKALKIESIFRDIEEESYDMESNFNIMENSYSSLTEEFNQKNNLGPDDDDFEVLSVDRSTVVDNTELIKKDDENLNEQRRPLFIHFRCSVKHDDNLSYYYVNTLPTCFCEVLKNCYPSSENVDWSGVPIPQDVTVTLDILCLTLPNDAWTKEEGQSVALRATSFCSTSPGPQDINDDEREENFCADEVDFNIRSERIDYDSLDGGNDNYCLTDDQNKAIKICVDEIKWMLNDEKASFARDVYPIDNNILDMVTNHIYQSQDRRGCCCSVVPLHFVFDANQSLMHFEEEFKRMNVPGYQVTQNGEYYYLAKKRNGEALDNGQTSSKDTKRIVSNKEFLMDSIPHQDDATEFLYSANNYEANENWRFEEIPKVEKSQPKLLEKSHKNQRSLTHIGRKRKKSLLNSEPIVLPNVDGYEGDGSDFDNDVDIEEDLDNGRLLLPRFWLILKISCETVYIWFQFRDAEVEDPELNHYNLILEQVTNHVEATCKVVNQARLLQELHRTRICHPLLEPETNEDVQHVEDLHGKHGHKISVNGVDYYIEGTVESYIQGIFGSSTKHNPGVFSCPMIWEVSFHLHPRIKTATGPARGPSRGVQALRSVLTRMSVSNRKNMFVYKANYGGAVFYIRLHEITSSLQHQNVSYESQFSASRSVIPEDGMNSLLSSRSSSLQSLIVNGLKDPIEDGPTPRFRVNSLPERDQNHDTMSMTSRASISTRLKPMFEDIVVLSVHGIAEVGYEITEDLVIALQSRLDDAVLEVISVTLARNPMCKLTPEDVQFIQKQKPFEPPKTVAHFKVSSYALPYLQVVAHYLGQNLVQFLSVPKYIDGRVENHFRRYLPTDSDNEDAIRSPRDSTSFLYIRPPEAGHRGIACMVLSLVDGQGNLVKHVNCPKPQPNSYKDGLATHDFHTFTSVELYKNDSKKYPGPLALIEFQIWEKGKVDLDYLVEKIRLTIKQSLWDFFTEYRVLVAPITETSFNSSDDFSTTTYSEPSTPVRVKRASLPIDSTTKARERAASPLFLLQFRLREMSSSVPDVNVKCKSSWAIRSITSASQEPLASPPPAPLSATMMLRDGQGDELSQAGTENDLQLKHIEKLELADKSNLYPMYLDVFENWMSFANEFGVPSVFKSVHSVASRHSVEFFLRDLHKLMGSIIPDSFLRLFKKDIDGNFAPLVVSEERERKQSGTSHLELRLTETPGKVNRYIGIARNPKHWKMCGGHLNKDSVVESIETRDTLIKSTNEFQRFTSFNYIQEVLYEGEESQLIFIPRQRVFLISVHDTQINIYMYNWSVDIQVAFMEHVARWLDLYNVRSCYLSSIALQKLGLFSNQPVVRGGKGCKTHGGTSEGVCMVCKCAAADSDNLLKRTVIPQGQTRRPLFQLHNFTEILRGNKPHQPVNCIRTPVPGPIDTVIQHVTQMCQLRNVDPKDHQKKLMTMWRNRESRFSLPITLIKTFSRIDHYCFTPLLFHPLWRNKVASARDHTIACLPCSPNCIKTNLVQTHPPTPPLEISSGTRSRHSSTSAAPLKFMPTTVAELRQSRKTSLCPTQAMFKCKCAPSIYDEWHTTIISNYVSELIQYLQTLGFNLSSSGVRPIKPNNQVKMSAKDSTSSKTESLGDEKVSNVIVKEYLQKLLLGGIILLELTVEEPYCCIKMYIFETMRLRALEDRTYNSQFITGFLDEIDKMKISMHLHSFTYDYHLRHMHAFVSGRQVTLKLGYHAVGFLSDFLKYYQKSPNFARNLVHQGTVCVGSSSTLSLLLMHLLKHDKMYEMRGLKMIGLEDQTEVEHVLVQMSSHKLSYRDGCDVRQTDDFDVSLLIAKDELLPDTQIDSRTTSNLQYFIILTSCREMFPKSVVDKQSGTFKYVITTALPPSRPPSRPESQLPLQERDLQPIIPEVSDARETSFEESDAKSTLDNSLENPNSCELTFASSSNVSSSGEGDSKAEKTPRGIRQEIVNYMGYYSSHEDLMHNIMMEQVQEFKLHIEKLMHRAMVDCQRDSCWERLHRCNRDAGKKEINHGLSYSEFTELLNLVYKVPLAKFDSRLETLTTNMPITWYQNLAKVLLNKYNDCYRHFTAADGNTQHVVILNANINSAFMLLSIDLHFTRAEMHVVFLNEPTLSFNPSIYPLIENVVNTCCFHMWTSIF